MYGSGVIPLRFKELKRGIKDLVMEQFFQEENVARFLDRNAATLASNSRLAGFSDLMDYDGVFDTVKSMVLDSGFGGLLSMFGGETALEKYRPVFRQRGLYIVRSQVSKPQFRKKIREKLNDPALRSELIASLESLVEDRLKELTPVMVKEMMQRMIRKHLGWLVVWGGIFGALIGVIVSFFGL